jgi:hypothetical protein
MVLVGTLCAAVVLAAAPRAVVIKKKSGEVLKGAIVSELESGYLIKLDKGGTVKVGFEEIADLNEPGAKPGPAAAVTDAPSPPPPPPYTPPSAPAKPAVPLEGPCQEGESFVKLKVEDDVAGPLCVDRTEVTVAQFQRCVDAAYCKDTGEMQCGNAANWGRPDRANHPINCVSAIQGEVYCAWKHARLMTQPEWDALTVLSGNYPWGDDEPDGRACWSGDQDQPRTGTCAVGSFPKGLGRSRVYDLSGNVAEWTSSEKRGKRLFVGGAFNEKSAKRFQMGGFGKQDPTSQFDDVGFRCVRTAR